MSESVRIRAAAAIAVVEDLPVQRPKTLRPVPSQSVATPAEAQRKGLANRKAALELLQLRNETGLTQIDAAALTGDSSRTIGNYERADVDLGPLRVFLRLLEFRAEQLKKGGR